MSCNLKLVIPRDKLSEITKDLSNKYEVSGVIYCNRDNKVVSIEKQKGDADSVQTKNHVINYHTHPLNAYKEGQTVWGWPSGEDVRETLKFALAGNKGHLVITMEGVYTIQVSPCKLKKMKELLNSIERGILIFLIEEYFKTTHNFRGIEEVKTLSKKGIKITPHSYVDFINNFDLVNLTSSKTILHKKSPKIKTQFGETFSKIPNIGFPEMENNYITNIPLKDYISKEDIKYLYPINEHGEEDSSKVITLSDVLRSIKVICKKFKVNKCNTKWNNNPNAWFYVNLFDKTQDPYLKIFSTSSEGCSINEIGKFNNFENKNHEVSFKNTFGNGEITPQQRFLLYQFIFYYNSFDPLFLTNKVNEYIKLNKIKINNVRQEINKINTFI